MSNSPAPMDSKRIVRASVVGVGLAIFGIIAFIGLWVGLGSAGLANAPRLFASLCVPPLLIAVLVGGYVLVSRSRR